MWKVTKIFFLAAFRDVIKERTKVVEILHQVSLVLGTCVM